ncbi:MAG: FmdB family zinc ribbon protein, partial [Acidimicrobiales bacterium]
MPTYEYACRSCGHHLEVSQSFSDEPLSTCPTCGGSLRKVFGTIGIVLKGSGFYKTDSRSSANRGSGSSKGDRAAAGGSESSGSSDGSSSTGGSSTAGDGSSAAGDGSSKAGDGSGTGSSA